MSSPLTIGSTTSRKPPENTQTCGRVLDQQPAAGQGDRCSPRRVGSDPWAGAARPAGPASPASVSLAGGKAATRRPQGLPSAHGASVPRLLPRSGPGGPRGLQLQWSRRQVGSCREARAVTAVPLVSDKLPVPAAVLCCPLVAACQMRLWCPWGSDPPLLWALHVLVPLPGPGPGSEKPSLIAPCKGSGRGRGRGLGWGEGARWEPRAARGPAGYVRRASW